MTSISDMILAQAPKPNNLATAIQENYAPGDVVRQHQDALALRDAIQSGDMGQVLRTPGGAALAKGVYDAQATAGKIPLQQAQTQKYVAQTGEAQAKAGEASYKVTSAQATAAANSLAALSQKPDINPNDIKQWTASQVQQGLMTPEHAQQLTAQTLDQSPDQIRATAKQLAEAGMTYAEQIAAHEKQAAFVAPKPVPLKTGGAILTQDQNPQSPTFGKTLTATPVTVSPDAQIGANARVQAANISAGARMGQNQSDPVKDSLAQALHDGKITMASPVFRKLSPTDQADIAQRAGPEFVGKQQAMIKGQQNWSGNGAGAKNVESLNKVAEHSEYLDQLVDASGNSTNGPPIINKVANALGYAAGATPTTQMNVAKSILTQELQKFIAAGGSTTEGERTNVERLISSADNKTQMKAAVDAYKHMVGGQIDAVNQHYVNDTGDTGGLVNTTKLLPAAKKLLQTYGSNSKAAAPSAIPSGWSVVAH